MRAFPQSQRTPAERRLRRIALLLVISIPVALLAAVCIAGGRERASLSSGRSLAVLLLELWIPAALIALGAPLRRLRALKEEKRQALVRALVADLRYSEDETLFSIAFHAGCGEARALLRRGESAFTAEEQERREGRWTPTGRIWRSEEEAALWQTLDSEGYGEIAWYEERP